MRLAKGLAITFVLFFSAVSWGANAPTVTISVDATHAPRKVFHASLKIPASAGDLTLYYPKWIPGEHAPDGPVVDPLAGEIAQGQLHVHFPFGQLTLFGQLAQAVQLLWHPAQDLLEEVLAEVPVVHFEVDVFLDDGMAGLAEDGGEGGKAEIGFGGEPGEDYRGSRPGNTPKEEQR